MADAYIIDAVRTPRGIGKQGKGALAHMHPQHLAATVLKALKERNNLDTAEVDDVIWGTSTQRGKQGNDMARMALLDAGYSHLASGVTLDRFCGGGITAVNFAAAQIMSGMEDLVIAGGTEMMSLTAQMMQEDMASGKPPLGMGSGNARLQKVHPQSHQGICGDAIASKEGFTREELDEVGYRSHCHRWGYRYLYGTLQGIDRTARRVHIAPVFDPKGREVVSAHSVRYDYLVLAYGSVTNDFGTPGVADNCLFLDSRAQADSFRDQLLDHCLRVSRAMSADLASDARVRIAQGYRFGQQPGRTWWARRGDADFFEDACGFAFGGGAGLAFAGIGADLHGPATGGGAGRRRGGRGGGRASRRGGWRDGGAGRRSPAHERASACSPRGSRRARSPRRSLR